METIYVQYVRSVTKKIKGNMTVLIATFRENTPPDVKTYSL